MKKVSEAGKGGNRRNEDKKRVDKNWDAIKWPTYSKEKEKKQLDFYFIMWYNIQSNYFNDCPYGETVYD